jgi:hypothetical protein
MRVRRLILAMSVSTVLAVGCAVAASPALTAEQYVPGISFGEPCGAGEVPCGAGKLDGPAGIAISNATGDVYVADEGDDRVEQFSPIGTYLSQFNGRVGPPTGIFSSPEYVAVDNSTNSLDPSKGDVYVADNGHHVIDQFTAEGTYIGQITGTCPNPGTCPTNEIVPFSEIDGVAAGPEGEIWVHDSTGNFDEYSNTSVYTTKFNFEATKQPGGVVVDSNGNIYGIFNPMSLQGIKLSPTGEFESEFAEGISALAIASVTNDVLVDKSSSLALYAPIVEFNEAPIETFATEGLAESHGVAVNAEATTVYASQGVADDVETFDRVSLPGVVTGSASEVSNTGAMLGGTVDPEGEGVVECRFEYGLSEAGAGHYEHSVPCAQEPSSITGAVAVPVSAIVSGLRAGATYHFRLVARNTNGTASGSDVSFTLFPTAEGESFSNVGSSSATLHAQVNPGGIPTSYFFEYGPSTAYGSRTAVESAGAGSGAVSVLASVEGLLADTVYHFRVVASNTNGATSGSDVSFSTLPASVLGLPDGRGYELVSSLNNGDATVVQGVRAASDGDSVAYTGQAPPAGGNGNSANPNKNGISTGGDNQYLARRSGGGWTAEDIQPDGLESVQYQAFSSDLSVGILSSKEAVVKGAPDSEALYARDDSDGSYRLLGTGTAYAGSTPTGDHLLVSNGTSGLYQSVGGQLDPVNILPEGGVAGDAFFGAPPLADPRETGQVLDGAVSSDGSRMFWTEDGADGQSERLFVSEDVGGPGQRTVQFDSSRVPGVEGGGGRFSGASNDGSKAFFIDCNRLTANSTAEPPTPGVPGCERETEPSTEESFRTLSGNDLYEFDLETGGLTDLSVDPHAGETADVVGVLGVSGDGSDVYFAAGGALASGAEHQECLKGTRQENEGGREITGCNVYVVRDGGAPEFVALVRSTEWSDWTSVIGDRSSFVASVGGELVFESKLDLTGFGGGVSEVFMFVPGVGLSCLSCNGSGRVSPPGGGALLPESGRETFALRDVSADGGRVFFDSSEGLVSQDENGQEDVYEWERDGTGSCERVAGCLFVLSGGVSTDSSSFVDASENGDDVFFVSRADLVPRDHGEVREVFDARVGALPEQSPVVCEGSGCQGVPGAPPVFATPSSATFSGAGNFPPPPPPGKARVKSAAQVRAEKLTKALKECRKDKAKKKRAGCERTARGKYGVVKTKKTTKKKVVRAKKSGEERGVRS